MSVLLNQTCGEKFKIVNRNLEYNVSKKLICSIVPYFKTMFQSDSLESKENKVELDFDERVFDSILGWVHSGLFIIQMDYVISFYDAVDYFMLNESLSKPCFDYFHENFTIEYLPVILPQVTKVSKLINSRSMENLICRHFLQIVNTDIFLDYPVEIVESILKLDLMVYSELQIFESIMKWANKDTESRNELIPQLLNHVRWPFMDKDDITKLQNDEYISSLTNFVSIICANVKTEHRNRSKQNGFVSMHRIDASNVRINVFDDEFRCLPLGDFTQDDSMSLEFVPEEQASDILFDSGIKGVRIDWVKKTFRWLDFKVAGKTYYSRLGKFICKYSNKLSTSSCYLHDKDAKLSELVRSDEFVFLEANGKFILVGRSKSERKWFGFFPVKNPTWFNIFKENRNMTFHATVLDNTVYILTKELEFIRYNYVDKCGSKSEPFKDEKMDFNELGLTSHQTGDDKVFLVDKSSGKIYVFCTKQKKWLLNQKYQIMSVNVTSKDPRANVNKLIAFTSTFLPIQNINPLYTQSQSLKRAEAIERRTADNVKKFKA
ncbi:uncharacterized protein LOC107361310 [Tetranychus urticae]|uniref:uncharacterized protein LOC107361310 n=1 Tax=Tetranychus urticae TaxID=32264 RepID=UPI00077BC315|nr:uncharacterized protein LOC107361310 [Tetranychus urticae]